MLQRRPAHIKNITECIHIDLLLNMLLHIVDDPNQPGTFQMCCLFRQLKPFGIVRLFFPFPAQRQQKQLQIQQNHLLRAVGRILPKSYLLDPGNIDRCAECPLAALTSADKIRRSFSFKINAFFEKIYSRAVRHKKKPPPD